MQESSPPSPHSTWTRFGKGLLLLAVIGLVTTWLVLTPSGLLGKADAIGYAVCHRIESRSFLIGERATPLCARCSGMYLGMLVGLLYQARLGLRAQLPPLKITIPLSVFLITFGIDGLNSYLQFFPQAPALYQPSNWLRLATGTGLGILVAVIFLPVFHQAVWRQPDDRPALASWRQVAGLLAVAAVTGLAIYSGNPLLVIPLALLSTASILIILTLCYGLFWVVAFKRENSFAGWRGAWVPLLGGFLTAMLQVALIDLIRYTLTGTWAGFSL